MEKVNYRVKDGKHIMVLQDDHTEVERHGGEEFEAFPHQVAAQDCVEVFTPRKSKSKPEPEPDPDPESESESEPRKRVSRKKEDASKSTEAK